MLVEQNAMIFELVEIIFRFLQFMVLVYNIVFFIWILASWLPVNRSIIILQFVDNLINPVYHGLLKILPPIRFGIMDFSPFYMYIFLITIEMLLRIAHTLVIRLLLMII